MTDNQKFIIHTVCKVIDGAQKNGKDKEMFYTKDGVIVTVTAEKDGSPNKKDSNKRS